MWFTRSANPYVFMPLFSSASVKKKLRRDEIGSNLYTFDCVKSLGSPLGITRWNIFKIKISNVKGLLALEQYEVILGGENFL